MTEDDLRSRLARLEKEVSARHVVSPEAAEALIEILRYRDAIVRDYRMREARRLVWEARRQIFREWQGTAVFMAAGFAATSASWEYIVEVLKWLASRL